MIDKRMELTFQFCQSIKPRLCFLLFSPSLLIKQFLPETFFFSFLKPWADNGSTNQYSCQLFYRRGNGTTCTILSQKCIYIVGEGPGETPPVLRYLSYLINKLTNRHILSPSDAYARSFPYLLYFNKTLLNKMLQVVKPRL